ncbi:MAG: HI0074 family nucleotidyltransferase substrate-binding subunit [bacterium]|nr:HI0074 family nucleotidyltransferase substrate-binding subunit [bacterium]
MENILNKKILLQKTGLVQALERLNEALSYQNSQIPARLDVDAAIQRFEFCYELSWKLMQSIIRYKGKDGQSPRDCFRTAAQLGIINNPDKWIEYLDARNLTVHTYDQSTADLVYKVAKQFTTDVSGLLESVDNILNE